MKINRATLITSLTFLVTSVAQEQGKHGTFPEEKIMVNGTERRFRLDVPNTVDLSKPAPIVFYFHGAGGEKDNMKPIYLPLVEFAKDKGFLLVYPYAVEGQGWNQAPRTNDDLTFFDALYQQLTTQYKIDHQRVYATGCSAGAFFSNFVAAKRSEIFAAVAPHSGGLGRLANEGINAKRKYAVLLIHGDSDHIVNVSESRKAAEIYKSEGHEVEYLEIPGLGHKWATNQNINATIWEFFQKHPMK